MQREPRRWASTLEVDRGLERVAVHAIPIGVCGEAEGAVGLLTTAATTEKTACVAICCVINYVGIKHNLPILMRFHNIIHNINLTTH